MNDCCQIGLRTLNHLADNLGKHLPLLYVHVLSFPSLIQRAFMITAATRIKFTDAQVATLEEISKIDMGIYQFTHSLARCSICVSIIRGVISSFDRPWAVKCCQDSLITFSVATRTKPTRG